MDNQLMSKMLKNLYREKDGYRYIYRERIMYKEYIKTCRGRYL